MFDSEVVNFSLLIIIVICKLLSGYITRIGRLLLYLIKKQLLFYISKMASSEEITKKVINSPESCVDDNLRGVIATYPMLQLHPKHRVITVRNKADTGRVAIIGGGGSGHEPFASGYVGEGMLDGAVAGGIFASPPAGHVLYGIAHLFKYNSGGVLVIIGNYTGDRLNFGKAVEKAKIAGIKVDYVIVGEDVATSHKKTGGRAMVGEVLFYKLCGALSQRGEDLETIRNVAVEANRYMATLGVCLSPCSLPGQPPLFEIAQDEMELGAGVHGEAGIAKMKMGSAKEVVAIILDKIVVHLKLKSGDRVIASINNLGGTSILEMNIISAEIKDYLANKNITLERTYSGHLKSSLDMHGFQICLLHLNKTDGDLWLELLDAPSTTGCWTGGRLSVRNEEPHIDDNSLLQADIRKDNEGPAMSAQHQDILRGSLACAAQALVDNEQLLNKLDSGCGDGDCGITLKKFGESILRYLKTASMEYPSNVLWDLAEIAETGMGGTSGGIYSLGLGAASQVLASSKSNDLDAWLGALGSAIDAITKYGGAEPGDRTMLDTLYSAYLVLKENSHSNLTTLLTIACSEIEKSTESTANMVANAGRASYVSADYVKDEDAGARGVAIWLQGALRYVISHI